MDKRRKIAQILSLRFHPASVENCDSCLRLADEISALEEKQPLQTEISDCACKECIDKNHSVDANETIEKQEGCTSGTEGTKPHHRQKIEKLEMSTRWDMDKITVEKVNELIDVINSWEE